MQSEKPTLSIIVPAYNEGRRIDFLMTTLLKFLPQTSLSYEIILVDDGSSDNTYQLAYHYQKNNISIIKNNKNYGKGYAIKVGVEKAQGKYILFMDADLSTSLEEISPFLSCLEKDQADIVIGTRQHGDAKIAIPQPWLRKSLGRFFIFLTNLLLRVNISDINCGFKCFRSDVAKKILGLQKIRRWAFDAEILYLARLNKFKIVEIPVRWKDSDSSTVSPFSAGIQSFIDLFRIRFF